MQHGSSSSSSVSAMGASAAAAGGAPVSSSSRQHRNERGERILPTDRTFPPNAGQRPPQNSNSNGPIPSRNSSNTGVNVGGSGSNSGMPNMPSIRAQSSSSSSQQQSSRHSSSAASASSMPNKMDQRHLSKDHKSHPDKNLALKHSLASKSATQQHFSGSG